MFQVIGSKKKMGTGTEQGKEHHEHAHVQNISWDGDVKSCGFQSGRARAPQIIDHCFVFAWSLFDGMNSATMRKFVLQENGEHTPTKVGLGFETKLYASIKDFLMKGTLFREARSCGKTKKMRATMMPSQKNREELAVILKFRHGKDINDRGMPLNAEWEDAENVMKS